MTVRELSDATKFKPGAIRKALKALARGKYINFTGDKARSPLANKVVKGMPDIPETAAIKASLRSYWKAWLAESKLVSTRRTTIRMTKANLEMYRQHLEKAVSLSAVYDNAEADRQDSAVYYIDASIFQIFPK